MRWPKLWDDIIRPTRRKFLWMTWGSILPRGSIDICDILDQKELLSEERFYGILKKIPMRLFQYEKWDVDNEWTLVSFPDEDKPLIKRTVNSELRSYSNELLSLFWTNSQLLKFLSTKDSFIEPCADSYEANKVQWDVKWGFDLLNMVLIFHLPWKDQDEEYQLDIDIFPIWDWRHIWDWGVILSRIDNKKQRITNEYEISVLDDDEVFRILRMPIAEMMDVFKECSWHKAFDKIGEQKSKEQEKIIQYSVPTIIDKNINFLEEILNWRIEVTDEVRKRVIKIFS